MSGRSLGCALAISAMLVMGASAGDAQLPSAETAHLGECALEAGGRISDCRIRYRTLGVLSPAGDNVVLVPTWFTGNADQWITDSDLSAMVDTTRYHVVIVDAFGNGRSSSPSNTPSQSGASFPRVSIRDMVAAQHRLLTERLGIDRLHAVVGYSMGGMQALEWGAAHPEIAGRLVAIAPSPRLSAYDRVLWRTWLDVIEVARRYGIPDDSIAVLLGGIGMLAASTPAQVNELAPDEAWEQVAGWAAALLHRMSVDDVAIQLRAMLAHDVSEPFDGELGRAAAASAPALIIYSPNDHMVTPESAIAYARMLGATIVPVPSHCGHQFLSCERARVEKAVQQFLGSAR